MDDQSIVMEDFHQQEDLTTRLSNILREYPPGIGPFQEMLQNADDAGASRFVVVYDTYQYQSEKLVSDRLADHQGRALYFYNDAEFADKDFVSISSVGKSVKRDNADTIGKYGLGFNTVYHFSDVVSFVSSDSLVIFDPHGQSLPGKRLGVRCQGWDSPTVREKFAGHADAFDGARAGLKCRPLDGGTLFRMALRDETAAKDSAICDTWYSHESMLSLLQQFGVASQSMLHFLRHVEEIEIRVRDQGQLQVAPIAAVRVAHHAVEKCRLARATLAAEIASAESSNKLSSWELELECWRAPDTTSQERWLLTTYVGPHQEASR